MSNEFPGNVFVSRQYPPPQTAATTYEVSMPTVSSEPSVSVTGSDSVHVGDLIDAKAAADILGVTTNNLRQMVHKGRLPIVSKSGRRNMFSRADVVELKEKRVR